MIVVYLTAGLPIARDVQSRRTHGVFVELVSCRYHLCATKTQNTKYSDYSDYSTSSHFCYKQYQFAFNWTRFKDRDAERTETWRLFQVSIFSDSVGSLNHNCSLFYYVDTVPQRLDDYIIMETIEIPIE